MIRVFYSYKDQYEHAPLEPAFQLLPPVMQHKISSYKNKKDRQQRIVSKLMLNRFIKEFLPSSVYTLEDIKYTACNKPYINDEFHFSISYTNNFVVCAASDSGSIGIDIEMVIPVDAENMKNSFTADEWTMLDRENLDPSLFYRLWTRKEAALKAIGKGIYEDLYKIDVLKDTLVYEKQHYFIQDIPINEQYKSALVSMQKQGYMLEEFTAF